MPRLCHAATVTVNGEETGGIIWLPKQLRIRRDSLQVGENTIEIAFCNTLANHVRSKEFEDRLRKLGVIKNRYFQMTKAADRRMVKIGDEL